MRHRIGPREGVVAELSEFEPDLVGRKWALMVLALVDVQAPVCVAARVEPPHNIATLVAGSPTELNLYVAYPQVAMDPFVDEVLKFTVREPRKSLQW